MPDKCVIVSGAARGLGEATVRQLIQQDCSVVMFARDAARLRMLEDSLWRAVAIPGDITRQADCENLIEQTISRFGKLDALINCAAVIEPIETIERADAEAWAKTLDINLLGPLRLTSLALPHLFQQTGKIIHISSKAVHEKKPGFGAYSSSKAALNHLTQMTALENQQVLCLAVGPGAIDADMQQTAKARAVAALALYADFDLQGQFVMWDDARVQRLAARCWKQ